MSTSYIDIYRYWVYGPGILLLPYNMIFAHFFSISLYVLGHMLYFINYIYVYIIYFTLHNFFFFILSNIYLIQAKSIEESPTYTSSLWPSFQPESSLAEPFAQQPNHTVIKHNQSIRKRMSVQA